MPAPDAKPAKNYQTTNIRPDAHRAASAAARLSGKPMTDFMSDAAEREAAKVFRKKNLSREEALALFA